MHECCSTLTVSIQLGKTVEGVTVSNRELCVITSNSPDIDIYEAQTLAYTHNISVPGLKRPFDIVGNGEALFISDYRSNSIHRVQRTTRDTSKWEHSGTQPKLSVTHLGNLLVSSRDPERVVEYSSDGIKIREVDLVDNNLIGLHHAVQVTDDRLLICHANSDSRRVCFIDSRGKVIKSYGDRDTGSLNCPFYLAKHPNGTIYVADPVNNQILRLNENLEFVYKINSLSTGLEHPFKICLSGDLTRLYVAEHKKKRIVIFAME